MFLLRRLLPLNSSLFPLACTQGVGRLLCLLLGSFMLCLSLPQIAVGQEVIIHSGATEAEDGVSGKDADGLKNNMVVWKGGGTVHVISGGFGVSRDRFNREPQTLRIERGAIVKFAGRFANTSSGLDWLPPDTGAALTCYGNSNTYNLPGVALQIEGATLTDIRDDEVGGDTNRDGSNSIPRVSVTGIQLAFSGTANDYLRDCTLKYVGNIYDVGSMEIANNRFFMFGTMVSCFDRVNKESLIGATPIISGNTFELAHYNHSVLNFLGHHPVIHTNTFRYAAGAERPPFFQAYEVALLVGTQDLAKRILPATGTTLIYDNTFETGGGVKVYGYPGSQNLDVSPFYSVRIENNTFRAGTDLVGGRGDFALQLEIAAEAVVSGNEVSNYDTPLVFDTTYSKTSRLQIQHNRFLYPVSRPTNRISIDPKFWRSGIFVNAENNYWGDVTGPYDASNADGLSNARGKGYLIQDGIDYQPFAGGSFQPAKNAVQISATSSKPVPFRPADTVSFNISALYRLVTTATGKIVVFVRDENGIILAQSETNAVSEGQTASFPPLQIIVPELSNIVTIDAALVPNDNSEAIRSNIQSFRVERPRSSFAMNIVEVPAGGTPQLKHGFKTKLKVVFNYTTATPSAGLFEVTIKERTLPLGQVLRTVSTFTVAAPSGSNKTVESAEVEVDIPLRDIVRDLLRRDLHCQATFKDGAGLTVGKDTKSLFIDDGPNSVRFDIVAPGERIGDSLVYRPHLLVGKFPAYAFQVFYRVGTPNATGWQVRVGDDQALDEKGNLLYQYAAERAAVENASTSVSEQVIRNVAISRTPLPPGTRTLRAIARLIAPGNIIVASVSYDIPVRDDPNSFAQKAVPTGASQIAFTPLSARLNFTSNQKAGTATVEEYAGHVSAKLNAAVHTAPSEAAQSVEAVEATAPVSKLIPLKKYWAVYNDLDDGTFAATLSLTYNPADFPPLLGFNEDTLVLAGLNPLSGEWEALSTTLDRTARTVTTPYLKFFEVYTLAFNINARTAISVSGASYRRIELATESIASAFGENLATESLGAATLPLPTTLAGTRVLVRDSAGTERFAPLFYVAPLQVNYQIPPGTTSGPAMVLIQSSSGEIATNSVQITAVTPGVFSATSDGKGLAAAHVQRVRNGASTFEAIVQYEQGKSVAIPIDLGTEMDEVYLVLYSTGVRFRSGLNAVKASIGEVDAPVVYAGKQCCYEGLDQFNIRLPRTLIGRGEVEVVLTVEGQTSNPVRVQFR